MTRPAFTSSEARGFTLIEILVSVGIIALLMGLLIPVLASARVGAYEQRELVVQRDSGMSVFEYANDHDNLFPGYGINGTDKVYLKNHLDYIESDYLWQGNFYWTQSSCWMFYMDGLGYDVQSAYTITDETNNYHRPNTASCGFDSMTFAAFARPVFFNASGPRRVEDHILQKITVTASPSSKIMLQRYNFHLIKFYGRPLTPSQKASLTFLHFFIDGHSAKQRLDELGPSVVIPDHVPDGAPGLTTLNGLLGHDI